MNMSRTFHRWTNLAAVLAAVLPSLVQAFIPTIPNYSAGLDLAIAKTGTVFVAQAQEIPAYNAKGEPLSDSRFRYVFNAFGWLTSVTNLVSEPASYVAFAYDTAGRRVRKSVYERNGAVWVQKTVHQFYYDGWNLVAETVTDKTATPESTLLRLYTWGLDLAGQRGGRLGQSSGGIGGLLAITEIAGTVTNVYYPVSDHIGTIRALVDAKTGALVAEYEYDPYGVLLGEAGEKADVCSFRFSGKYYDPETQLLYFGYRYYSPASTKWLTVDPLQERGGLNFTAYCAGDPVNQIDPLGLSFLSWLLGCGWNTEEARAFDDYLHEDYWGGDFSKRGVDAINAELKMTVGAVEALAGVKLAVFSSGLASAGGYALVADGSSWMCGGAGDYLNVFRDNDIPDYDVVGVGFRQMAGPTWGPVARSSATMGLSMGTPVLVQQQMNAAMTAEARAIRLQSQSAAQGLRVDTHVAPVANSQAVAPTIIKTPYGSAVQHNSQSALTMRSQIQQGRTVYKGGVLGKSETDASQFLATESPLNAGYAARYGIPTENANFDFILTGKIRPGAPVITRPAPGIPPNPGEAIEGVVNPGDFLLNSFYMP